VGRGDQVVLAKDAKVSWLSAVLESAGQGEKNGEGPDNGYDSGLLVLLLLLSLTLAQIFSHSQNLFSASEFKMWICDMVCDCCECCRNDDLSLIHIMV
jgi:hypothetical protein